jgi:hypothetical protein
MLAAGFDEHLVKPVNPTALAAVLRPREPAKIASELA